MADAQLSVELQANIRNFVTGMRTAGQESTRTAGTVEKSASRIGSAIGSQLAGVFSAGAIIGFGKAVLDATAQFQKFEAVLGNTLGSSALASLKLKEIQDFAANTPFAVNELTGAFVKLANSGFKPTGDQMRALGDLASSTGKSFDQLAEAILDAQSGEFERLKEFGVRAKDAGDSVIFTYKGVQTQVDKTSEAIRGYITGLGDAEGVSGSMAKISATLGGQISNLGDTWDQMLLSVGGNTEGVFSSSIAIIDKAIKKVTAFNNQLELNAKYNLGSGISDVFAKIARATGTFKGQSEVEIKTGIIQSTNKDITDFVNKSLTAAKSADDFGRSLAELKKRGDEALGRTKDKGLNKAVSDIYQLGVQALQDARTNFGAAVGGGNANFGTAKKSAKDAGDILKELGKDLDVVGLKFGASFSDQNKAKIDAYQKAIDALSKDGTDKAKASIDRLIQSQRNLFQLQQVAPVNILDVVANDKKASGPSIAGDKLIAPDIKLSPALQKIKEDAQKFTEEISSILTNGLANGLGGIGAAIGNALAEGGNVFEAVGQSLLKSVGGILVQLGEMAIGVGIGIAAIKKALQSLNPVVAVAAGIALIALGSFITNKVSGLGSNSKANTQQTAFANGGIVYGPTNALVGEYAGAKNNPEVIAPLNKLKGMLGDGNQTFIPEVRLKGEDLYVSFNRTQKRMQRT